MWANVACGCRLGRVESIVKNLAHGLNSSGAHVDLPSAMHNVKKLRASLGKLREAELQLQHQVESVNVLHAKIHTWQPGP